MSEPAQACAYQIRPIEARDNDAVRDLIQRVMPEFGASGPGFAIHDPEVQAMFDAYQAADAQPGRAHDRAYFVVTIDGIVSGGGGVAPLQTGICELRKMYFLPELRGQGAGAALMQRCLSAARALGYQQVYLETLTGMDAAVKLYLRSGFREIPEPMGQTGHFGCDRFFLLQLS